MTSLAELIGDHRWLPHRLNAQDGQVHFVRLERADHRAVTFLEDQYIPAGAPRAAVPFAAVAREAMRLPAATPRFVFHSSMALSTLVARIFDAPGVSMGLKEPVILNDVAAFARQGQAIGPMLDAVLRLLARPFAPGEAIVIKPGNVANSLIPALLDARPDSPALFLYAPLPVFLRSIAKKGMFGRITYRRMFMLMREDRTIDSGFSDRDLFEQTDLQIAALLWLGEQARFARIADAHSRRTRTIDSEALLADRAAALAALAALFGLALDVPAVLAGGVFNQHSKELGRAFDAGQRASEHQAAGAAYGEEIEMVGKWTEAVAAHLKVPLALGHRLSR